MEIFTSVISQIAVLFSFIITGFIICRAKLVPSQASVVFSKFESMIFMPAVIINTFWKNCTIKNITEKWIYIVYSAAILLCSVLIAYALSGFFGKTAYLKKIYRYSLAVSNFGFVGTAMVSGIYGPESIELFDYLMFTLPLNIFTYSIGILWLIPEKNGKFSFRSFVNPIFISLFIGGALGIFSIQRFHVVSSVITSAANCMSPIAMILTGYVIGGYKLSALFKQWQSYAVVAVRLVAMPSLFVILLKLINTPSEIIVATLCANSMPLGLNTVIIPYAYGEQPHTGASLALVSQLSAVITIPVLFMIFTSV